VQLNSRISFFVFLSIVDLLSTSDGEKASKRFSTVLVIVIVIRCRPLNFRFSAQSKFRIRLSHAADQLQSISRSPNLTLYSYAGFLGYLLFSSILRPTASSPPLSSSSTTSQFGVACTIRQVTVAPIDRPNAGASAHEVPCRPPLLRGRMALSQNQKYNCPGGR
jgi:hypothetical protein